MKAKRAFKTYCKARDVKLQEDSPPLEGAVPDIPAEIRLKTWSAEFTANLAATTEKKER